MGKPELWIVQPFHVDNNDISRKQADILAALLIIITGPAILQVWIPGSIIEFQWLMEKPINDPVATLASLKGACNSCNQSNWCPITCRINP